MTHANAMRSLVYRECFCKCSYRPFGGDICGRKQLPHRADEARHVNDVAFRISKMWQSELAAGEYADQIQVKQISKFLNGEVVDRFMRRMPSSVVDKAIEAAELLDRRINEAFNLIRLRDIALDEQSPSFPAGVEFRRQPLTIVLIPSTEDNRRTCGTKCAHASFADSFGATRYDNHLFGIVHTRAKPVDLEAAEPRPSSYSQK